MTRRQEGFFAAILAGLAASAAVSPAWAGMGAYPSVTGLLSHYFPDIPLLLILITFFSFLFLLEGFFLLLWDPNRVQRRRLQKRLKILQGLEQDFSASSLIRADTMGDLPWL